MEKRFSGAHQLGDGGHQSLDQNDQDEDGQDELEIGLQRPETSAGPGPRWPPPCSLSKPQPQRLTQNSR